MSLHRLKLCCACCLLALSGQAAATEFDESFLQREPGSQVSLEAFRQAGFVVPGWYIVDVYLNQRFFSQEKLEFRAQGDGSGQACLPPALVARFGLRADLQPAAGADCVDIEALSGGKMRYRNSNARLDIALPQAALAFRDERYAPPASWSDGIPAALLDYRIQYQRSDDGQGHGDDSVSAYGVAGANLGPWRLRSNYQYDSRGDNPNGGKLYWNNAQAYRDLRDWQARLTLGEQFQGSDIFDAYTLRGVGIASDERMMPQSLRGYAPQISGVARSNARVTVRSQGRVLYAANVPPGPFVLRDLGSSVQGKLDVSVEESDGSRQQFSVNTMSVPFMTRQGMFRYKAGIGQALLSGNGENPQIASGELSWGVSDTLSLYGGGVGSQDYQAGAIGAARDFGAFGALSFDVTQSHVRLDGREQSGRSYRFNYAKKLEGLDADLRLFGYRFSDRNFWSLNQYLNRVSGNVVAHDRQRVGLTAGKAFGAVSAFLSAEKVDYWDAPAGQRVDLSLSRDVSIGVLRHISLNLSLQKVRDPGGGSNRIYLGFSLPLDGGRRFSYSLQRDGNGTGHSLGYADYSNARHGYDLAASEDGRGKTALSGNYRYEGEASRVDLSASRQQGGYSSLSAALASSVVLHGGGVTLNKASVGQTRILVSTDGVAGMPLADAGLSSDRSGYAVLDGVAPYEAQEVRLDADHMPDEVEGSASVRRLVLTEGAVGRADFEVRVGRKALLTLRGPEGRALPLGAQVWDTAEGARVVGMVGDGGLAFLTGLSAAPRLEARWGQGESCRLAALPVDYALSQGRRELVCAAVVNTRKDTQ